MMAEYKRQYKEYKDKGGTRSYGSWIKWKGYGKGVVGSGLGDFVDPRLTRYGVLVPKFATDLKFLKAFSKAVPHHHGFLDMFSRRRRETTMVRVWTSTQ